MAVDDTDPIAAQPELDNLLFSVDVHDNEISFHSEPAVVSLPFHKRSRIILSLGPASRGQ